MGGPDFLLAVRDSTGSYTQAGFATAVFGIANAVAAVYWASLTLRRTSSWPGVPYRRVEVATHTPENRHKVISERGCALRFRRPIQSRWART